MSCVADVMCQCPLISVSAPQRADGERTVPRDRGSSLDAIIAAFCNNIGTKRTNRVFSCLSAFGGKANLLSWAGFVPRLDESAGKRRSTRIRKGAPWLKPVLVEAAWGAAGGRSGYFRA